MTRLSTLPLQLFDHESILSATIPCKSASSVVEPVSLLRALQVLHHPQSSDPRRASLSSDNYDFTQFGQWDGDSASYFNDDDQPPTPQVLPSILTARLSTSPLTPLASPSTFVQEFEQGSSTTGVQYEYVLEDVRGTPLSGLPSPITRPTTPLEYEEEYNPEFNIRTQVAVRSTPRSPTLELVYPDPPSEPTPISRPVSAPPRVPSPPHTTTPPRVPTPDSPINYERVAEQGPLSPPPNQENILPATFFRPPSCVNSPDEHPHQYIAVYTEEGESWRPASNSLKNYFQRIPQTTNIVLHPRIFPSVTPFCIPPPHLYTLLPRTIDPAIHPNFPALYICSKAILDLPSADLPLGTVRYDFREGLRNAFAPLSTTIRAGYIDSLVTLEIQDFLDGRIVTTYGHLRFTFGGQVFAHYQGYFFEDIIRSNPSLLAYCLSPRVPADPFDFIPTVPDNQPLDRQVHRYYPSTSIDNLIDDPRIHCWTEPPLALKSLTYIFEFGETWDHDTHNDLLNDLSAVVDACNDQLLFWHLSDITTDALQLWTRTDYLWFNYIPPRQDYLIRQLQHGNPIHFIEKFRLSYEEIQINFGEIRVLDRDGPPHLVPTEGVELTYSWREATWETTLTNPDSNLVNPRVYSEPLTSPDDPELVELLLGRRENPLGLLARLALPDSSPENDTSVSSNTGWAESTTPGPCWCTQEVCICGYRPDTPPTPESVVLWAPGINHLPFRENITPQTPLITDQFLTRRT
ncbi:hypothetical protein EDB89DRAFT_2081057 [Lactarius sanguifluus]|nr:hypothetical protein EDB89DRAFT_2081057 [Lactarius sanguifluus]